MEQNTESELACCAGLDLSSTDGVRSLLGGDPGRQIVDIWLKSGGIAVTGSPLDSVKIFESNGTVYVQDNACSGFCGRGRDSCRGCLVAASRSKLFACIREWSLRITYVDLTHAALGQDSERQQFQADLMKHLFLEVRAENLESAEFADLILKTRNMFMHVAVSRQNEALKTFISRALKYLQPKMLAGVSREVRKFKHVQSGLSFFIKSNL